MNLIRDGGFGRGDLEFWESVGDGSVSISSIAPMHGVYCALMEIPIGHGHTLIASDYIPVIFGQITIANYYAKVFGGGQIYTRFYEYDGDLNLLKTTDRPGGAMPAGYKRFEAMLNPQSNTEYMRIGVYAYADESASDVKVDTCYASVVSGDAPLVYLIEIIDAVGRVSGGDTSDALRDMLGFRDYYAEIECSTLTGTSPTLDVEVCEKDNHGHERILGTFTQISGVADQRVGIARPIGKGMYVKYVEGGTWTACSFKVSVIGVR